MRTLYIIDSKLLRIDVNPLLVECYVSLIINRTDNQSISDNIYAQTRHHYKRFCVLEILTLNFKDITFLLHLSSLYIYINTDECWSKAISRIFVWLKNLYFYCLDFYCYWLLDIIGDQCFFCCWLTRHKTVLTVTINNLCNCASLKCEKNVSLLMSL